MIFLIEFCTLIYSYSESAEDRETNVGSNYQVLFSFKVATHNVWARARPTVTESSENGVEEGNRPLPSVLEQTKDHHSMKAYTP